ncbi:MAG: hypothetical protein ACI4L9_04460 [Candidatus Coproplasma sp.]
MKAKLRNLIAVVAATVLLGSAVGTGVYVYTAEVPSNKFGLNGYYSASAFADTSAPDVTTVIVGGNTVDVSAIKSVISSDKKYILFITAIDVADLSDLPDLVVGYKYNGKEYNGISEGLTNAVYSSVTIKTGDDSSIILQAKNLNESFTKTKFIVAEIPVAISDSGFVLADGALAIEFKDGLSAFND